MSKIYSGIMGLVVGDALGVPVEFKARDTFKVSGLTGYGTYNQPAGTWSDDSSMTLATVDSLIENNGHINVKDIMQKFDDWLYGGKYTPYGKVFDVGNTTRNAITRYRMGIDVDACGGRGELDNGNGSLMRILPLAFIPDIRFDHVDRVSALTHAHNISQRACYYYVMLAISLLKNYTDDSLKECIEMVFNNEIPLTVPLLSDGFYNKKRDEIKSTGYVVDSLEAAVWCLYNTDSYRDCVLTAVNLGGDTDTIAAIAGGIAGLYYGVGGEKGIPQNWIDNIARKGWIEALCASLEKVV